MIKRSYVLKENITGKEIIDFLTKLDVTMNNTHITFEFECKNSQHFSAYSEYNAPIWEGDVCEAFICTNGKKDLYYEIEVAPNGTVFLKKMQYVGVGEIIENDIGVNFVESKVEICGRDYKVKFSVPLDKIDYDENKGILFNAFRIETEGGIPEKNLLALNPTLCDTFHNNEFFIELK